MHRDDLVLFQPLAALRFFLIAFIQTTTSMHSSNTARVNSFMNLNALPYQIFLKRVIVAIALAASFANASAADYGAQPHRPMVPAFNDGTPPVSDSMVPWNCKELIDAATNAQGMDRKPRAEAFVAACPGIAYQCHEFKTHPQDNYCRWIARGPQDPIANKRVSN